MVDVDLEKFFDRVNHDVLMGRLAKRIEDKRMLGLIRRYLEAGIMADGVVVERHEGTPQGGPLSPLLANVLLDEVDKELEKRGHAFVRYADDCNVYVRSRRAGERVMETLRRLYAGLRLRVNETKSAVAPVRPEVPRLQLLVGAKDEVKRQVARKALERDEGSRPARSPAGRADGASTKSCQELRVVPARAGRSTSAWPIPRRSSATSTIGFATGCARCNSNSGSGDDRLPRAARAGVSPLDARRAAGNATRWWRNSGMVVLTRSAEQLFDELGLPRLAA